LFCFTRFTAKDFVVLNQDDETISFTLDLSEEVSHSFINNFGDKAVIFPGDFPNLLVDAAEEQGLDLIVRPVSYEDYNYFSKQRKQDFEQASVNMLFTKDIFFQSQREMRFVILNRPVESNMSFHIASLKNNIYVFDTRKLLMETGIRANKQQLKNM
jgi:hypothetical protein